MWFKLDKNIRMYLNVGRVVHHMAQYLVLPTHKGAKQQVTFRDIWGYGKIQSYSLSYQVFSSMKVWTIVVVYPQLIIQSKLILLKVRSLNSKISQIEYLKIIIVI